MDGAQLASIAIAEHKARTAAKYRRPTMVFEDAVQKSGFTYQLSLDDVIASRGGKREAGPVPLWSSRSRLPFGLFQLSRWVRNRRAMVTVLGLRAASSPSRCPLEAPLRAPSGQSRTLPPSTGPLRS